MALFCALMAGSVAARDSLVIGVSQFPPTFNPNIDTSTAGNYVLGMARRPFTTFDTQWSLVCMLCTEVPSFDNHRAEIIELPEGKKGIRLTFTIRPDARWGDGVPITTKDVLFTYEVGRHPKSGINNAELYRRITGLSAKDDKTFVMEIDKLTFDYAGINDFDVLPEHIEREAFADPEQYHNRSRFDTDPTNPGLYFGPYRITEVVAGSYIVLEPNPTWWGEKPSFPRIVVQTVENTASLEANLLAGSIDMIAGELGPSIEQALAFEARRGKDYTFLYKEGLIFEHIDVNLDHPILKDKRVRQALLYGIDRKAISTQLFGGKQPVADSFVPPLDWVHADDLKTYPYDPDKARAVLDEAGWRDDGSGIRRNAAGERLTLELATTAGNRTRELVEEVLQSQWRKIGVAVRLKNQTARILFGETIRRRNFSMAMFAWSSAPENVPRSTLHSSEIPSAANSYVGQNDTGFRSEEADSLIDRMEIEFDREKRNALWHRLQEIYVEELPSLPLYFRSEAYILPKWLKGVTPTGHQYPSTLWVEHWRAVGRPGS